MKIEAKLLASAEDTRIKKIRAPNFFIFSTNTEKTLFGAEPPGGLLNMKKNFTTRAFTNSDLAELSRTLELSSKLMSAFAITDFVFHIFQFFL